VQLPVHLEPLRDRPKLLPEGRDLEGEVFEVPLDPHQKQAGVAVLVLIGVQDVRVVAV